MTTPTQQPTQQELAADGSTDDFGAMADLVEAMKLAETNGDALLEVAKYRLSVREPLIALIAAQQKKIAEQDAQLQAAYP